MGGESDRAKGGDQAPLVTVAAGPAGSVSLRPLFRGCLLTGTAVGGRGGEVIWSRLGKMSSASTGRAHTVTDCHIVCLMLFLF